MTGDPANWRATDPGIGERLRRALTEVEIAELEALGERFAGQPASSIRRDEFCTPAIDALTADLQHAVMAGAGAILLTGIDLSRIDAEIFERIFWGLGTHLGEGAIQGPGGERIARVEQRGDNPERRGTLTDQELRPHTDMHELLALGCVRQAETGGESTIVSAAALHAAIAARSSGALALLEAGYYVGINEAVGGAVPVSAEKVPIFSVTDGKLSCCYNRFFFESAARLRGEALPPALTDALALLDRMASDPALGFTVRLAPGEMLFWHNWTCLHARRAFHDTPDARRLLLRLWLNVRDGRPVDPRVAARAHTMDADHHAAYLRTLKEDA